jgi:hypothetical protein
MREDLWDAETFGRIFLQNLLDEITRFCERESMLRDDGECADLPSESHSGSLKSPLMILLRMTVSSSSSKGSVPVRRQ